MPEMLLVNAANVVPLTELAGNTFVNVNPMAVGMLRVEGESVSELKVGLLEVEKDTPVWPSVPLTVPVNEPVLLRSLVNPLIIENVPLYA